MDLNTAALCCLQHTCPAFERLILSLQLLQLIAFCLHLGLHCSDLQAAITQRQQQQCMLMHTTRS